MKLLSLFSGIGAFEKALDKMGGGTRSLIIVKLINMQVRHTH